MAWHGWEQWREDEWREEDSEWRATAAAEQQQWEESGAWWGWWAARLQEELEQRRSVLLAAREALVRHSLPPSGGADAPGRAIAKAWSRGFES